MNRIYFLASLLAIASTTNAQIINDKQQDLLGQGSLHVGANANLGYSGFSGLNARFTPRIQYFLTDGWSVAAEGRIETNGRQYSYVGAGLSTRYYFIRDRRLAVFGQAGATYGQSTFLRPDPASSFNLVNGRRESSPTLQVSAGLGVHYRLSERWSIEGMAERTITNYRSIGLTNYSRWQGSIGVNFRLKK